uniref:Uncharacterized protein n=1 Tax=viral metagenome TaxID=1070528 RepID=A0A6M3JUE1_9ZZZZ
MSIKIAQYNISVSDTIGVSEFNNTFPQQYKLSVYDGIGATDTPESRTLFYIDSGFDQIAIQEVINLLVTKYNINVSELVSVAEFTNQTVPSDDVYATNISDLFGLSEGVSVHIPTYHLSVSDSIGIEDYNAFVNQYHIGVSDTFGASESVNALAVTPGTWSTITIQGVDVVSGRFVLITGKALIT